MNTTKAVPTSITIGARSYHVDADGWCGALECYIARNPNGQLVTIPVD